MDSRTYIQKMRRTESADWDAVRFRAGNICTTRLLHAALGITSELTEFRQAWAEDEEHQDYLAAETIGELGDLWWFTALGFHALGKVSFSIMSCRILPIEEALWNIECASEVITSAVKAQLFYGRAFRFGVIEERLIEIAEALTCIGKHFQLTNEQVWDANIAKLTKRFPEKFDEGSANDRNVDAEFDAIKEHMR